MFPLALFTVLDVFDAREVTATFYTHGFGCSRLDGVFLNQRNFFDDREREGMLGLLDPTSAAHAVWLQRGKLCAGLFVARLLPSSTNFKRT